MRVVRCRKQETTQPTRRHERVWIAHWCEMSIQAGSIIQMRTPHRATAIGVRTFHGDGLDSPHKLSTSSASPPTACRPPPAEHRALRRASGSHTFCASCTHPAQSGGRVLGADSRDPRGKSLLHGSASFLRVGRWGSPLTQRGPSIKSNLGPDFALITISFYNICTHTRLREMTQV